jgi:aldehyde dehydrogenase (NAD+)
MDIAGLIDKQRVFYNSQFTKVLDLRTEKLCALADGIRKYERELTAALYADLHKSEFEAYSTETGIVLSEIRSHIKHLKKRAKARRVATPAFMFPSKSKIISEPYGIVLIVAPWNYSFQLIMSPLAGAIAAGNCVILKPSPLAPATAVLIEKIISETFDPQHVAVVKGEKEVMEKLLNEKFDYIFFTGSPGFGKVIMQAAARNLTPVTLELGGKSPCIVTADADLRIAARRIVWGKFLNAGQTCVAPDYLFVEENVRNRLTDLMKTEIKTMFGNNPQASSDFGRIVNEGGIQRLVHLLQHGTIVEGGTYNVSERYLAPTIIDNVRPEFPVMQEEIFGPILPVMSFKHIEEVIAYINSHDKPLALYIFASVKKTIDKIINETSSGGVCINDTIMHLANEKLPFGGVGNSGMGNYHGKYSFETFSHQKAVVNTPVLIDPKMRYAPYGNKVKWLKHFFK